MIIMPENENEKGSGIQALISITIVGLLIWALIWSWSETISEIDKSGGLKCVLAEFWENGTGKNCGK